MLEFALSYLARGWSVVPGHTAGAQGCSCRHPACDRPGKHPRVKWREFQERLPTEAEVRYWWRRWQQANIIIITGKISGFIVIDVDPRHAGDEAWEAWTRHNPVPDTIRSLTGGGGTHYLFQWPGEEVRNAANLLPGIDFRGDGGFIVAPPSRHESGGRYDWDVTAHPEDTKLAKMPPPLLRLITHRKAAPALEKIDIDAYMNGVKLIGEGERNDILTRIAGRMAHTSENAADLEQTLQGTNMRLCIPPLDEREIHRIAASIWGRERDKQTTTQPERKDTDEALREVEKTLVENPDDRQVVSKLLGIHVVVTDWFILRGTLNEYVLVTPEDEIRLGSNLLNYDSVATRVFNETGELMTGKKDWAVRATALRKLAREEFIEPMSANDQVMEWLGEFIRRSGVREVEESKYADRLAEGPLRVVDEVWIRPVTFSRFIESTFGERMLVPELRKLLKRSGWAEGQLEGGIKAWHKPAPAAEDTSTEKSA